jgi:hypothetical protein
MDNLTWLPKEKSKTTKAKSVDEKMSRDIGN